MRTDDLESRMRRLEWFHDLRVLPGAWTVIRVDGRAFTSLSNDRFQRPFDEAFHQLMVKVSNALMDEFNGILSFSQSDEASIVLPPDADLFNREVEKLVSISAAVASSVFSLGLGHAVHFDSRIWMGAAQAQVVDYFRWRQADAQRSCLNGWCYWTLRQKGESAEAAAAALEGLTFSARNELLFSNGRNFNDVPSWQKHGFAHYWERFAKEGFNPKTQETVLAERRRLKLDRQLPRGDEFALLVTRELEGRLTR